MNFRELQKAVDAAQDAPQKYRNTGASIKMQGGSKSKELCWCGTVHTATDSALYLQYFCDVGTCMYCNTEGQALYDWKIPEQAGILLCAHCSSMTPGGKITNKVVELMKKCEKCGCFDPYISHSDPATCKDGDPCGQPKMHHKFVQKKSLS